MDHTPISEGDLAERYATDRLAAEERAAFEAHLVDCAECLDRVEAAQGLVAGFRGLPGETVRSEARRARPRWAVRAGWAVAAAAAVAMAVVWGTRERDRLEQQLVAERDARNTLEVRLREAQAEAEAARNVQAKPPQRTPAQVPDLTLVATRGTGPPALRLPAEPSPVVLSVERESPPRFQAYRVELRSATGERVLEAHLAPSSREAVVLALDSGLLGPGEYLVSLEGEGPGGKLTPVGRHRFLAVR